MQRVVVDRFHKRNDADAIPRLAGMGLNDEQIAAALGLAIEEVRDAQMRSS